MSGKNIDNMLDSLFGADSADSASEKQLRSLEGELGVPGGPAPRRAQRAQRPQTTEPGVQLNVDAGRRREPVGYSEPAPDQPPARIGATPAPAATPGRPSHTPTPSSSAPSSPAQPASPQRARATGGHARQRSTQPPPAPAEPRPSVAPARVRRTSGSHRRVSSAPRSSRATAGHRPISDTPRRARTTSARMEPSRASRAPSVAPALVNSDDLFAQFDDLELEAHVSQEPTGVMGDLDRIARLLIDMHAIDWSSLDPRAGFLITQVDGATSFNELMILTGLPQADATALVELLITEGILG